MDKKRVLIVTQEMKPYLIVDEIAKIARELPQHIQENGMEIRVLMPRFGDINERRNRLHEVVRLSGINITVDDEDYPLVIKVASLPGARMQVYFLDNEDLFKRKGVFHDNKGKFFADNDERMIFFCKGVLETVKKFGWPPDIIHCIGAMTSLIPFYLKSAYKDEPIFENSKVVYSVYGNTFQEELTDSFFKKLQVNGEDTTAELAESFKGMDNTSLHLGGSVYADGVIVSSGDIDDKVQDLLNQNGKPILAYDDSEEEDYLNAYQDFYNTLLGE